MGGPSDLETWLDTLAESVTRRLGVELVNVSLRRRSGVAHIVVTVDKEGGVTIDDCQRVSQALEVELDCGGKLDSYSLEVESPGLDRQLRTPREFNYFRGREVEVITHAPLGGRRRFTGTLLGLEGDAIVLAGEDGTDRRIPRDQVAKAKLRVRI